MSFVARKIKKIILFFILLLLFPLLFLVGHLGFNYFTGNIHAVIPGVIYRTAQLDHQQLIDTHKKYHFNTMINLRGSWPTNHWYQVETRFAKNHQIKYVSIHFISYELPTKTMLRELVTLLLTAPKPLVFHCQGGADRTGMAAAISVILFDKNASLTQIKRQDSWRYNVISRETIGYQVLRNYFEWLNQHHYQSSKAHFLTWLNSSVRMKPYYGWFIV